MIAQNHFLIVPRTGNNSIIGIPISINPIVDGIPLELNDEVAVFADGNVIPDSFCVGAAQWTNKNTSITVWGDNEQTATLDGIKAGTKYRYRIWKSSTNKEYINAAVTYAQGDSLYRVNGISVLASLSAGTQQVAATHLNESGIHDDRRFVLNQNMPNPFNPSTVISYQVPSAGGQYMVSLQVFDVLGRMVATLFKGTQNSGTYFVRWNASGFSSGIYFCCILATSVEHANIFYSDTKKLVLTR